MATLDARISDPLVRLPYELWVRCLYLATCESIEGPLPFLSISQKWNDTILEEPALWSTVIVNGGEDEVARLMVFLYLSGSRLLDVVIRYPLNSLEGIKVLTKERERIRSLSIYHNKSYGAVDVGVREADIARCLTQEGVSYPQMKRISLQTEEQSYWKHLISHCPNLLVVRGLEIAPSTIVSSNLELAATLVTSLDEASTVFKIRSLTSLYINYNSVEADRLQWANHAMQFDRKWALHANQFDSLSGTLKYLKIFMDAKRFIILPFLIPSLSQLQSLELELCWNSPDLSDGWDIGRSIPQSRSIKHLALIFQGGAVEWSADNIKFFMGMLLRDDSFKPLETFFWETSSRIDSKFLTSVLFTIPEVHSLTLHLRLSDRLRAPDIRPVALRRLSYLSVQYAYILDFIDAPEVIDVAVLFHSKSYTWPTDRKIGGFIASVSRLTIVPEVFDRMSALGMSWRSLRCMEFTILRPCKALIGVNLLYEINFGVSIHPTLSEGHVLDAFLLDLLHNLGVCPNLNTIKSSQYPIWELLFEVLRRRNANGLSSIKQFTFLAYPVPPLLSRLVLLLQGRSDVYTTRDVDKVILKRFQKYPDVFSACILCAAAGYTCCYGQDQSIALEKEVGKEVIDLFNLDGDEHGTLHRSQSFLPLEEDKDVQEWAISWSLPGLYDYGVDTKLCSRLQEVDINGFTLDGMFAIV